MSAAKAKAEKLVTLIVFGGLSIAISALSFLSAKRPTEVSSGSTAKENAEKTLAAIDGEGAPNCVHRCSRA